MDGKKPNQFVNNTEKVQPQAGPNLSSISRRLRMLEERYTKLISRLQLDEHDLIEFRKKTNVNIKTITSELDEVKSEIAEIKDRIILIVKELKMTAKKDDVKVLKRYIEMWEPVNFVTIDKLNKKLDELKEEINNKLS